MTCRNSINKTVEGAHRNRKKTCFTITRKLTFSVLTFLQVQNVDPSVPSGGKSSGPNGGRYTPLSALASLQPGGASAAGTAGPQRFPGAAGVSVGAAGAPGQQSSTTTFQHFAPHQGKGDSDYGSTGHHVRTRNREFCGLLRISELYFC